MRFRLVVAFALAAIPARAQTAGGEPASVDPPGGELRSADPTQGEPAEIVVEGQRVHPQRGPKDESVAATVVSRERLESPGLSAVGALRGTPGLVANEMGGAGSPGTVSLRGASSAQTPVYLAGVRLNDSVSGSVDLARIPLWFVDRIEVYRGNAPIDADRLGMGGAIFIEPRKPGDSRFDLGGLVGSYGTVGAQAISSAGTAADGVVAGVGLGRAENDYSFRNGQGTLFVGSDDTSDERERIDASWFDAWVHGRRRLGPTQLSLVANYGRLERGAQRNESLPLRRGRERSERELVVLGTRTALGDGDSWVETTNSVLLTEVDYDDPLRELGFAAARVQVTDARADHGIAGRFRIGQHWLIRPRLSFATERLVRRDAEEGVAADEPALVAHQLDLRPLVASDLAIAGTPVVARAVIALECNSGGERAPELCSAAEPVGRFGPTLLLGPLTVYANAGRYVRQPTLGERFGVSPLLLGTPDLRPEKGINLDAGVRYAHPRGVRFWFDVVGYARFARDGIRYPRTGLRKLRPQNVDDARFVGLEVASGITPLEGIQFDLALSLLDARDTSPSRTLTNDVLPRQPRLTASPSLTLERRLDGSALDRVAWVSRFVYQSSRYDDLAGNAVLPEQTNLETELDASWFARTLVTRARIDNVLDAQRSDALGAPLPGRSIFVSVELAY